MTKKINRKLHIGSDIYHWVVDKSKLDLYPYEELHIRVHQDRKTKSILYIDANARNFEISPRNIKCAIEFALLNNWDPKIPGGNFYVSMNDEGFYVLPQNIKHDFLTHCQK